MSPRLLAEIDGHAVPLDECDWVLWGACGCPYGVTVGHLSATEDDAWKMFFQYKREITKAQRRGDYLELMTHARWGQEVMPRMKTRCPHWPGDAA